MVAILAGQIFAAHFSKVENLHLPFLASILGILLGKTTPVSEKPLRDLRAKCPLRTAEAILGQPQQSHDSPFPERKKPSQHTPGQSVVLLLQ